MSWLENWSLFWADDGREDSVRANFKSSLGTLVFVIELLKELGLILLIPTEPEDDNLPAVFGVD